MVNDLGSIGLGAIARVKDWLISASVDSLPEYTQSSRVEPIVVIDADVMHWDGLSELQQSILAIFTGYYLQAVAISTRVGHVQVMHRLDKLNPQRSILANLDGASWSIESFKNGLPFPKYKLGMEEAETVDFTEVPVEQETVFLTEETEERLEEAKSLGEEVVINDTPENETLIVVGTPIEGERGVEPALESDREDGMKPYAISVPRESLSVLKEAANLSVGNMINVEIQDGNQKAIVPINIRLMTTFTDSSSMAHILSIGNKDISVKERYHAWRADRLEFIKDIVFCNDLIEAHRANLLRDKDGVLSNIIARRNKNKLTTLLSGRPSVATASNIAIISTTTRDRIELEINQSLDSPKVRQKLFKETSLMLLVVVDQATDRVEIFHRGIAQPTELSLRDMKSSNKGSGPNVSEILKAYQLGAAPVL